MQKGDFASLAIQWLELSCVHCCIYKHTSPLFLNVNTEGTFNPPNACDKYSVMARLANDLILSHCYAQPTVLQPMSEWPIANQQVSLQKYKINGVKINLKLTLYLSVSVSRWHNNNNKQQTGCTYVRSHKWLWGRGRGGTQPATALTHAQATQVSLCTNTEHGDQGGIDGKWSGGGGHIVCRLSSYYICFSQFIVKIIP